MLDLLNKVSFRSTCLKIVICYVLHLLTGGERGAKLEIANLNRRSIQLLEMNISKTHHVASEYSLSVNALQNNIHTNL